MTTRCEGPTPRVSRPAAPWREAPFTIATFCCAKSATRRWTRHSRPPRWRTFKVVSRNAGRYLFGSAIRNWARNIGSTAPALGSMTLLLLLVGLAVLAGLVGQNVASTEARDAAVLHIYLRDDANSADINRLETDLGYNRYVQSITYVNKAQALARWASNPQALFTKCLDADSLIESARSTSG